MAKKKQVARVVISRAHYDILQDKADMLDGIFGSDGALIEPQHFKTLDRITRAADKLDPDTMGPDDYIPPKDEGK